MTKKSWIGYILWLVGGVWGFHLLYLRRDRQAFVWIATFGGYWFGYIRDFFCIQRYVKEANDAEAVLKYTQSSDHSSQSDEKGRYIRPSISATRLALSSAFGFTVGSIFQYCLPMELLEPPNTIGISAPSLLYIVLHGLGPLGVAIGVHTALNIGRQKCSFRIPLYASFCIGSLYMLFQAAFNFTWASLITTVISMRKGSKQRKRFDVNRKSKKYRFTILTICLTLYFTLLISSVYFNTSITMEDGEEIKTRDAVNHFFESKFWIETKTVLWQLFEQFKKDGWERTWDRFVIALDPQGEAHAQQVLGVGAHTSEEDLRKVYKKLAREWHPDKHKLEDKAKAEKKFMEIQQAYETLSTIHAKRARRQQEQPTV